MIKRLTKLKNIFRKRKIKPHLNIEKLNKLFLKHKIDPNKVWVLVGTKSMPLSEYLCNVNFTAIDTRSISIKSSGNKLLSLEEHLKERKS